MFFFFFSSRRRHTRFSRDWSSDLCSSDLRRSRLAAISPPTLWSSVCSSSAITACDRKSVVSGKSVDFGGCRIIKKKKRKKKKNKKRETQKRRCRRKLRCKKKQG